MARGRKADPPGVKEAKGNTTRRPARAGAVIDAAKVSGVMPAYLDTRSVKTRMAQSMTGLTKQVWEYLFPKLDQINFVRGTDQTALARFCRYAAEWVYCTRVIDKEGAWYETSSPHVEKMMRPHPATRLRKEAEQAMRLLESELGLTPASRQRLMMQMIGGLGTPAHDETRLPLAQPVQSGPIGMGVRVH